MRIGLGYDSHRLVPGRKLVLGGVEIPHEKGLQGHSDADALLHAVGDALLGAIGERDLGTHFPDNDPAYRDIASRNLLGHICALMKERGFTTNNVDVTVILESPKLASWIPQMRRTLATVLDLPGERVSIKAKTNEGMGLVGRGEGIAVFAVATVEERPENETR